MDKFWDRVDKRGDDECWLWTGTVKDKKRKYPVGLCRRKGVQVRVHRLAYELSNGDLDEKYAVVQLCGESLCCNPKHLKKGRPAYGAKLTNKQVLEIRADTEAVTYKELGDKYGVSTKTIMNIIDRKKWTHI